MLGATAGLALMGGGLIGCATGAKTPAEAAQAADSVATSTIAPTTTVTPTPPTTGAPAPPTTGAPAPTTTVISTPPTTGAPTPTTAPPEPTTTVPVVLPSNAAGYLHATYDAWAAADRAAAALVAEPAAVDTLFTRTWSDADGWAFLRCEGAAGSVFCVWQREGEQLLMKARNADGGEPVNVVEFRVVP